jgi:formylglycine-generating enzyme required for sulfatase activity
MIERFFTVVTIFFILFSFSFIDAKDMENKKSIFKVKDAGLIGSKNFLAKAKKKKRKRIWCPPAMRLVYSKKDNVKVCVDKYEFNYKNKTPIDYRKPLAHQSLYSCRKHCKRVRKRLLSYKEWTVACTGTHADFCNIYRAHPVIRKIKLKKSWIYKGVNCKKGNNMWGKHCMNDPSLNRLPRSLMRNKGFSKCISKYGIYNMVGNLGEWVEGAWKNKKGKLVGSFNGGLYPQNKSSCNYITIAHGPDYKDYSTGCRCGKDPYEK